MGVSPLAKAVLGVLSVAACVAILAPAGADAQGTPDGPQFGNWGPGMAPPEQEGVDTTAPATGAPGSQQEAAAPYGGYAAPGAAAPAPPVTSYSACPYDLRGTWWNEGRQTSPGYRSYSAYVYVRQYRSWIHAQQDDGTSYYGRCLGSRLMFDVYHGYQYVGRQSGIISGSGVYYPFPYSYPYLIPLYGDGFADPSYAAPPAPAAPAPIGRSGLRASFTWTTFYGSGSETWQLTSAAVPLSIAVPLVPASREPVLTPTPATTAQAPRIESLTPARGPYGTEVVITGSGFAADNNLVTFGPSSGLTRQDGSPANLVARVGSTDGRTIRFTVPRNGPSGVLCDAAGSCINVSAALLAPGNYDVAVSNAGGASNVVSFEITAEGG